MVWDWLTPILALIVLGYILNLWWGLYRDYTTLEEVVFGWFLLDVATLLALFLMSAAVMPDEAGGEQLDLREFYMANRKYFWLTFSIYLVFVIARNIRLVDRFDLGFDVWMAANLPLIGVVGFSLVLVRAKSIWLHALMIAVQIYTIFSQWVFYELS